MFIQCNDVMDARCIGGFKLGATVAARLSGSRNGALLRAPLGLDLMPGERWFLVMTQPKSEARAEFHLQSQDFATFLPKFRKTVRHARMLRTGSVPLFPRYLFVALDLTRDPWLSVRSTVGVSSLYLCDNRPQPVPEGIVEGLIALRGEQNLVRLDRGLVVGQSVQILNGPFSGLIGNLQHLGDSERARVLVEIMGSVVPVTLQRSALLRVA
jgi:transcription elongation factor/antiterminator RfaH